MPKLERRFDPERRGRIIDAAIEVARDAGIASLTMRKVAERANVPLGSLSYHFKDKDELVAAAIHKARESNTQLTRIAIQEGMTAGDLAASLSKLIEQLTVHEHERLVLDHDLYLASIHHPVLQAESRAWSEDFFETMNEYTDSKTAQILTFLFDGICLQSALFGNEYHRATVYPLIQQVLRSA